MKAINLPSTVNFMVPTEKIQTVIELLISNHIAFTVTSSANLETAPIVPQKIEVKKTDFDIAQARLSPKSVTVETIYQKYLVEEFAQVPPNEAQIASEFGMTSIKFKKTFKAVYGKSFHQIYMEKRIEYAAQLLKQGYKAVDVSKQIGYGGKSVIKFNRMFQKHFGMTPKKYQQSLKGFDKMT